VGQATEIYSKEFQGIFDRLPSGMRMRIIEKIRHVGRHLESFPHERLQGRPEFRFRVGDFRIIYEFDLARNEISLVTLGHRREVYR
jgi:mRNA interferase RelE/StbE